MYNSICNRVELNFLYDTFCNVSVNVHIDRKYFGINNKLTDLDSDKIKIKNIPSAPKGKKIKDVDVVINIENGSQ